MWTLNGNTMLGNVLALFVMDTCPTSDPASANSAAAQLYSASFSQQSSSDPFHPVVAHNHDLPTWPTETNLIYSPGSNKVMLTAQRTLIYIVIQDAIERTRASMMFINAFPDVFKALELITKALSMAAEKNV